MFKFRAGIQSSLVIAGVGCMCVSGCGSLSKNPLGHPNDNLESQSIINVVPGEDSSLALLLGQGLDTVKNEAKGHCVALGELKTQSGNVTGQMAEFEMLEITSESALKSSLNISSSASFNTMFARGSARMNYASSINKNNQSKFLMVHTRVANQLELASSFTYTESAQNIIKDQKSRDFIASCGNEFVYGKRTGGEFYAVFEFEMTTDEESRAFSAAISASGGAWKASANINSALEKFHKFSLLQLRMLKFGGTSGMPQIDNLKDFSIKFDQLTNAATGAPVTLELITKNYDGVEPLNLRPNLVSIDNQLFIIGKLAESRDLASETVNSIRYIARNERFYNTNGFDFEESEQRLNEYINSIQLQALQCFEIPSACKLPVAFPTTRLPQRKPKTDLWIKLKTDNWIFSYPADQGAYMFGPGGDAGWIVNPGITAVGDGEVVKVKNQYLEMGCSEAFAHINSVGGVKPFFANDKLDIKTATRNDPIFDGKKNTQIEFVIKDKGSEKCLLVMFYTALPLKNYITSNEDTEIGQIIRDIIRSVKRNY